MRITIHQLPKQQKHGTAMALSKIVISLLVVLMINVANKPTLVFLTNTTNTANAFSTITPTLPRESKSYKLYAINPQSSTNDAVSRKDVIQSALLLGVMSYTATTSPLTATAADATSTATSGTKQDPKYEACLSKCMYDCTKPKGTEQKSRAVCLPECKTQCATTKQQLMIGTPIK